MNESHSEIIWALGRVKTEHTLLSTPLHYSVSDNKAIQNMATEAANDAVATVAENAPITAERKVRTDLETKLPNPCKY